MGLTEEASNARRFRACRQPIGSEPPFSQGSFLSSPFEGLAFYNRHLAFHFMYRFFQKQTLSASPEKVWDFISLPGNLNEITPKDMEFEIIGEVPERIFAGQFIEYRVKVPLLGRTSWLTEIKYLDEGKSFVDEQRVGPYKLWVHRHSLEAVEGGTEMTDDIRYALPFGVFGKLANPLIVRGNLKRIFDFRREALSRTFRKS